MNGCFVNNFADLKSKLQLKIRLNIRNPNFKFSQNLTSLLIISFEVDKNVRSESCDVDDTARLATNCQQIYQSTNKTKWYENSSTIILGKS